MLIQKCLEGGAVDIDSARPRQTVRRKVRRVMNGRLDVVIVGQGM